jgi:hypothetical protein
MRKDHIVYCPIAACHAIAELCDLPTDWEFWARTDQIMIEQSAELRVVKMSGWETSHGVQTEIKIAIAAGIPITFMEDELS